MITLQDEWKKYRDLVYPDGMSADQNRQIHQAFFAGAFVALALARAQDNGPELLKEAETMCAFRAQKPKSGN